MQYYLVFIILLIGYTTSVNSQTAQTLTVPVVSTTVAVNVLYQLQTTIVPVVVVKEETVVPTTTTVESSVTPKTLPVVNKSLVTPWPEPLPHPLGYCIRGRLRCSKIRRCCTGPCDFATMKCPSL
ncbi:hypothetical protein I4U23_007201 [Adineta vaga]|nr:hypothetical protein I4U23_007201 [Adineta vaga]